MPQQMEMINVDDRQYYCNKLNAIKVRATLLWLGSVCC
jgi:hypothetical protein